MQMKAGDTAWVQGGPFVGLHGLIVELDPDGTALVNVDVSGRVTSAELDAGQLGSSPPGAGTSGVREPRRPRSPVDSDAIAAPLPEE